MISLFAALDAHGEMRFIDEVPRGAACACVCPTCGSPLVAKQGQEVEWHYAHEGGQERPECAAGATNLLRRLAVEYLAQRDPLVFEPYTTYAPVALGSLVHGIRVQWSCQPLCASSWRLDAPADQPVACLDLPDGVTATLRVAIDDVSPAAGALDEPHVGRGVFLVGLPGIASLRNRAAVIEHLEQTGRFIWEYLPDTQGHIAVQIAAARKLAEQHAKEQRDAAGRRWANIRNRAAHPDPINDLIGPSPLGEVAQVASPAAGPAETSLEWAPDRKAGTPCHFHRLADGTRWVLYTSNAAAQLLAPYPCAFDGWDEYFPSRMAVPVPGAAVLKVMSFDGLLMFFRARSEVTRITSDPAEFENL